MDGLRVAEAPLILKQVEAPDASPFLGRAFDESVRMSFDEFVRNTSC
jgi:hypothetical protein